MATETERKNFHRPCAHCIRPCACGDLHCDAEGAYVCFNCLDAATIARYPFFRADHDMAVRRREQAIANFQAKTVPAT